MNGLRFYVSYDGIMREYVSKMENIDPNKGIVTRLGKKLLLQQEQEDGRVWTDLGGDLEGSYDGSKYVDIRMKGGRNLLFASREVFERGLALFPKGGE